VIDDKRLDFREWRLWATVFGMTIPTILGLQHAVERVGVCQMRTDIGVAGEAAISHVLLIPRRSMAGSTVRPQGSMRIDTAQHGPAGVGRA